MKDFKIRVKNEEESRKVQEELFRRGCKWQGGENIPSFLGNRFLFVYEKYITYANANELKYFKEYSLPEITVKQLLGGKKMKKIKPTHIVIWKEDTDPTKLCYSLAGVKDFVKDLLKNPDVVEDSIRIYEIKSTLTVKHNISFKKI